MGGTARSSRNRSHMRIMKRRVRRKQLKKVGWIIISIFATAAMVAWTVAPGLKQF